MRTAALIEQIVARVSELVADTERDARLDCDAAHATPRRREYQTNEWREGGVVGEPLELQRPIEAKYTAAAVAYFGAAPDAGIEAVSWWWITKCGIEWNSSCRAERQSHPERGRA